MDDVIENTNKSKKDKMNEDDLLQENKQKTKVIDTSIFDDTLSEIDKILNNLEEKSETGLIQARKIIVPNDEESTISNIPIKREKLVEEENNIITNNNLIKRIKELEKNISNSSQTILPSSETKEEISVKNKEHDIDKNLLSTEEIHDFEKNTEKEKKNFLGFYSYLILIIVILATLHWTIGVSKDFIILKYSITEPYIKNYYELVEIVKFVILDLSDFIKNKI
jgi:hypothetical protein